MFQLLYFIEMASQIVTDYQDYIAMLTDCGANLSKNVPVAGKYRCLRT